ncbi:glycosyltransferase domain-containing protein [Colwellia sp. RSH04]|uniref:glycosyltransferase domain-containing protein n=1 Tax=Colwellia sp. RSH04 TaxID=2305464 RepID=UPI0015F8AD0A|nr:glycosyltransferase domain-containing protein [Colwellia sp. RSH04]
MRIAYFIVGMHRSGTSAISGVLSEMGVEFGPNLMAASKDNPKGYFENNRVQQLNEKILNESYYSWSDYNFSLDNISEELKDKYIQEAMQIINEEFSKFETFAVKDPRFCILLPIWTSALDSLGISAKFILPFRNPLEVSGSLLKRNNFTEEKSLLLWATYFLYSEFYSRNYERVFVSFDELISSSKKVQDRLLSFIGNSEHPEKLKKGFIEPALRHHKMDFVDKDVNYPSFLSICFTIVKSRAFEVEKFNLALNSLKMHMTYFFNKEQHDSNYKIFLDRKRYQVLKDDFYSKWQMESAVKEHYKEKYLKMENGMKDEVEELKKLIVKQSSNLLALQKKKDENLLSLFAESNVNIAQITEQISDKNNVITKVQGELSAFSNKIEELTQSQTRSLVRNDMLIESFERINKKYDQNVSIKNERDVESIRLSIRSLGDELKTIQEEIILSKEHFTVCSKGNQNQADELKKSHNELKNSIDENRRYLKDITAKLVAKNVKVTNDIEVFRANVRRFNILYSKTIKKVLSKSFSSFIKNAFNPSRYVDINNKFNRVPINFIERFDSSKYLDINYDVAEAIEQGELSCALEHFILHGYEEVFSGKRKLHFKIPFYEVKTEDKDIQNKFLEYNKFLGMCYENLADSKKISIVNTYDDEKLLEQSATESPQATIDIILPVYNALEDVKNCLNSLYEHKSLNFNLIVIDDCSEKETQLYLESESVSRGFYLQRNEINLRFTKTVNKGFEKSKGDYIVLLNSDTIVTPRWIDKIMQCFASDPNIGIVGPLSNAASWQTVPIQKDKETNDWLVNKIPSGYTINDMGLLVEKLSSCRYPVVPSVNGFCYVIKREVIDCIGVLDVEYFPTGYGEEDDFSIRASNAGFKSAIADDTYVFHAKSKSYTHEVRKVLTKGGRKSLDAKHGAKRIKKLISDWIEEKELPIIAKHIESYMHTATNNKKVVYTAVFGNYDEVRNPEYVNEDWDYVCFTDNLDLKSDVFEIKYVKAIFENPTKNARLIKVMPHLFLVNYEYSLWIDGNIKLRGRNIEELVSKGFAHSIALHKHSARDCVFEEGKACIIGKKDTEAKILAQLESYRQQGMPEKFGMVETAEVFRKHDEHSKKLNELWWSEIDKHTIRDQLAFNFVCWKNNINFSILDGSAWLDGYFQIYKHGISLSRNTAKVAIAVFDDNQGELLNRLKRIKQYTAGQAFDVIVVGTSPFEEDFEHSLNELFPHALIHSLVNEKLDANLINKVVKVFDYDYICFMNSGFETVNSDWLSSLVSGIDSNENVTIASPLTLNPDYSIQTSGLKLKFKKGKLNSIVKINKYIGDSYVHAIHSDCFIVDTKEACSTKFKKHPLLEQTLSDFSLRQLIKGNKVKTISESQVMYTSYKASLLELDAVIKCFQNETPASFRL